MRYDAIIIGAGLSGLAAGTRLAYMGKRCLLVESHARPGGLSSWYRRHGVELSTGLHALTNYTPPGVRRSALTRLLRRLHLRREDLELCEQFGSCVRFPDCTLRFGNTPEILRGEVAREFPAELDGFDRLCRFLDDNFDESGEGTAPWPTARLAVGAFIRSPLLANMLLCPVMLYGNAAEDDMDFRLFVVIWKSIYTTGFCRPRSGIRPLLEHLVRRFQEQGGELRLGTRVREITLRGRRALAIRLTGGEEITADRIFSCAGYVETMRMCRPSPVPVSPEETGRISMVEVIACLRRPASELGLRDTITFFSLDPELRYRRPREATGLRLGAVTVPGNYHHADQPDHHVVRVSVLANHRRWAEWRNPDQEAEPSAEGRSAYARAKHAATRRMLALAADQTVDFREHVNWTDAFTPLTIERYTGRAAGALYGTGSKRWDGRTACENLFLLGTDQGGVGIVGALLSGITMANRHGR